MRESVNIEASTMCLGLEFYFEQDIHQFLGPNILAVLVFWKYPKTGLNHCVFLGLEHVSAEAELPAQVPPKGILHIQEPLQSKLKLCEEDQVEGIHFKTALFALNQNANVQATK